jgi:hypothetical protein
MDPFLADILKGQNISPPKKPDNKGNITDKINPPAAFKDKNVFASQPRERFVPTASQMKTSVAPSVNDPFFSKKDPVSMDTVVPKGTIAGSPYSASQYDTLTNLTKLNQMSLSGQLKNMMPVYEESTGRITGFKPGDAYKSVGSWL